MQFSFSSLAMPGYKARRHKFGIGTLIFMLIFGAIFLAAGLIFINSAKIDPSWTRISGTVIGSTRSNSSDSITYKPVVEYSVNGRTYEATSNSGSSSRPTIGSSKEVAYNPAQPDQSKVVTSGSTVFFMWLFPAVGAVIMVMAIVLFVRSKKRDGVINNLMQFGHKLQGVLIDIQTINSSRRSGSGGPSYQIVVAATNSSGSVQNYVSDKLSGIGGLAMADFRTTPIPIDVYVDPTNPQSYYVDVADIPNLTPQRIQELVQSAASGNAQSIAPAQTPSLNPAAPTAPLASPTDTNPPPNSARIS